MGLHGCLLLCHLNLYGHLLLGLLREEEGIAHRVLSEYGLTDEMITGILQRSISIFVQNRMSVGSCAGSPKAPVCRFMRVSCHMASRFDASGADVSHEKRN